MEIEAPPRAQWIRTILFEMSRIANVVAVPRRPRRAGRAVTPVFLPSATASTCSTRSRAHRWPLPPELRPHRWPQGRSADGLVAETKQVMKKIGFCDEIEDARHGQRDLPEPAPAASASSPPTSAQVRPVRCQHPGVGRRLGPPSRQPERPRLRPGRLEGLDPPRRRLVRRFWVRLQEVRESHARSSISCSTPSPPARHGQGAPHHQGARG